ncbi:MAG: efflux RND transporter periplasmic adaptor subunit [Mucilaginibacter polytrichastri]|nr:efflux RND transporter periplasmic adaptor subunit [Mucilaginibacter polytrichastri]
MKKTAILSFVLFLAACGGDKPKDKKAELAELKKQQSALNDKITKLEAETGQKDSGRVSEVSALTLEEKPFTSYVEVQGNVDAEENTLASSQSQGTITAIYVKPGQKVSRGQVLARLDAQALNQQIAQAQTQVDLMNTLFQRQKNLWDQKIGTEVQFLQAKTNLESAQKQLAGLKAQADMFSIKAPTSGTVDQMDLKLGQNVQPGSQGIRIVNLSNLKVKADVAESYAGRINTGDKVLVNLPDARDSVSTQVTFASAAIDEKARSFRVEVRLPERKTIRPNMTAVLRIVDYTKPKAIVVPLKSVQRTESGVFVFVADNGKAKEVPVKLGATYNGQTEVLSGLKSGDQVVIDGAQDIEGGDPIKVIGEAK